MKLRVRVQLFLSIFMIVVISLLNVAVYFLYENQVVENERNRVKENTENIMEAIAQNNMEEIEQNRLLQAFLPANGMIRIIDSDGETTHAVAKEAFYYNWPFEYAAKEQINLEKGATPSYLQISVPIIWEDGSILTLQVSEALYSMDDTLSTLRFVLLITTVFMLLPALIAGYVLTNYITKPIQTITEKMRKNPTDNKWEKIKIDKQKNDEILEMQHAYNAMIDRIEANRSKQQQFVSDASHELKTPLSVIRSYAELLERRGKERPELLEEATSAIISESDRMKRLTEQMLALAKHEDQESIQFEQLSIISLIRDVIRSLSTAYERKIRLYNKENQEITFSGDRAKILQAIYILIDNACKYSDSDQEIEVTIKKEDNDLLISVTDYGDGISAEDLEHIFERFYRVDKARSRKGGGTGLGLAICHQIITAHGGSIDVKSQLGEGTTFTIQLPV